MAIIGRSDETEALADLYSQYGIDPNNVPRHIAIIMDGNGRWAAQKDVPRSMGHREGSEAVRRMLRACTRFNIHYVSVFAFSTENWNRSDTEVRDLMSLFKEVLKKQLPEMHRDGARVRIMGDMSSLDADLIEVIETAHEITENNTTYQVNIMMNYGSRWEITEACKSLIEDAKSNPSLEITEEMIADRLCTKDVPEPDILLRSSGEHRISNFMLWQCAYSEFIFIDKLWPDVGEMDLVDAIKTYQSRDRRFGGR